MQKPISGPKLFRRGFTGRSDARQIPGLLEVPEIRCHRLTEQQLHQQQAALLSRLGSVKENVVKEEVGFLF